MKNKIKKLKLPLNKMTGNEKDYTTVLLEDVNSNMKAFWEVISGTQDDVKILKEQIEVIAGRLDSIEARLDSIEFKLEDLIKEISSIKAEIKSLKTSISAKADKEKFETLELRIIRIEKHLELSTG